MTKVMAKNSSGHEEVFTLTMTVVRTNMTNIMPRDVMILRRVVVVVKSHDPEEGGGCSQES